MKKNYSMLCALLFTVVCAEDEFVVEKRSASSMREYKQSCAVDLGELLKKSLTIDELKAKVNGTIVDCLFDMANGGKAFTRTKRSEYEQCHACVKKIDHLLDQLAFEYGKLSDILKRNA